MYLFSKQGHDAIKKLQVKNGGLVDMIQGTHHSE